MIYERVDSTEPIRQGDIFKNVPRVDFILSALAIIDGDDSLKETNWREALLSKNSGDPISAVLAVIPVTAIVMTQNCDAVRGESLSLCQIDDYLVATGQQSVPKDAKAWQSLLVRTARTNNRFFYLPEGPDFGFEGKMAADLRVVLRVARQDLEQMRDQRVARLNPTARDHFRECLGHFFRRYAYNEWYPLTVEELRHYAAKSAEPIDPFEWQK